MPRKIVILVSSMDPGGAERTAANLANAWSERGDEVVLIATFSGHSRCAYQLNASVRLVQLADQVGMHENGLRSRVRRVFALRTLVRAEQPDVVISFLTNVNIATLLATRGLTVPVIVNEQVHPPCFDMGPTWHLLRRLSYPLADRVVMLTPEGCDWLATQIPAAAGTVIPNPVQRPLPGHGPTVMTEQIVPAGQKLLLAAGRLVDQKGFDLLIAAFAKLASVCTDWTLVILGDGPNRSQLSEQIRAARLSDRILLPGAVGNIGAWFEAADLYVLSSRFEGFPGVLGEAMAHGCAVVAYDCDTGPRSMVRDGVDGRLVGPVGDVHALAAALQTLMTDEHERHKMSARAGEILDRYSVARVLGMWDRVFDDVRP